MMLGLRVLYLFALVVTALSDVYLHNPRGSNNRLNERSANRNNANRLFDSQNNNRGGYNAGDKDTGAFQDEDDIYYMKYFQSGEDAESFLTIEWTNQHGCGGDETTDRHKLNCNMVLQYMVMDYEDAIQANELTRIRNGENTNTQDYQAPNAQNINSQSSYNNRRTNSVQLERGLHEPFEFYDACYVRNRNMGLFTADQRLRSNDLGVSSAIYTRQNPNGNRRGYECPEERDYYPYWHPTPWRDMAVLTDNTTFCEDYQKDSFNVRPLNLCRERYSTDPNDPAYNEFKLFSEHNNMEDCVAAPGDWVEVWGYLEIDGIGQTACEREDHSDGYTRVWAVADPFDPVNFEEEQCLILPPPLDCRHTDWSRVNHLGNGRDGVPVNYTWKIPFFPSQNLKLAVVRIRYNISTDDYDPWNTDALSNEELATNRRSPVTQNPNVNIASTTNKPLRLAINTAQFGRTFQDRTHVMELRPRTDLTTAAARQCTIYNLNVRGKRGNIVQVYPSVEYDFVPNRLTINNTDCLHIQWTGSNTHNNGNPAGDGQAGDAGEGTGGTDRSNIVEIESPDENYPLPWEKANMFKDAKVLWSSFRGTDLGDISEEDLAIAFASAGYYQCRESADCGADSVQSKTSLQQLLNNAPASFEGALLQFSDVTTRTVYHYICSRNNNFTNRSQKGQLTIKAPQK